MRHFMIHFLCYMLHMYVQTTGRSDAVKKLPINIEQMILFMQSEINCECG